MTIDQLLAKTGKRISDEQRAAILTDNAAVVSAGAGSGKTTVLSLRFVRLVLDGKAHADEILPLTVTRKAAAEMYERIYALLSAAAEEDGHTVDGAVTGLQGWIDCFERARLKKVIFAGGVNNPAEIASSPVLKQAEKAGSQI